MEGVYTINKCIKNQIKTIVEGINGYILSKLPALADTWTALEFAATNSDDHTIAGILGGVGCWSALEIKVLWVTEQHRNSGMGSALLSDMETVAREKGAVVSILNTFDFQSPVFYFSNGYLLIGQINDFPLDISRMYFSKKLI